MTMWGVLKALQDQVGGANSDFDSLDTTEGAVIILYFCMYHVLLRYSGGGGIILHVPCTVSL